MPLDYMWRFFIWFCVIVVLLLKSSSQKMIVWGWLEIKYTFVINGQKNDQVWWERGSDLWPILFPFIQAMASYRGQNCVLLENEYTSDEVVPNYQRYKGLFKLEPSVAGQLHLGRFFLVHQVKPQSGWGKVLDSEWDRILEQVGTV